MKDSYPNSKIPGKGLGLKVLLFSSLLLCLISVVLFFALWFDPGQQQVVRVVGCQEKKVLSCHSEPEQSANIGGMWAGSPSPPCKIHPNSPADRKDRVDRKGRAVKWQNCEERLK